MLQFLATTWSKYKLLQWWQKCLLFLPLVIVAILCIALFFVKVDDGKKFEDAVKHHKKSVDKQIKEKIDKESELAKAEAQLTKKQKDLKSIIEKDREDAKDFIARIDSAAITGDSDELKRIQSELRARAKTRGNR